MITIREEKPGDAEQIRIVLQQAFGRAEEAELVDKLRQSCPNGLSLVGIDKEHVIGHILFTPVVIEWKGRIIPGMGLAPMAVLPELQRQQIGSKLVKAGLELIEKAKYFFVMVQRHPAYYPRFGFVPASRYAIISEYENVPDVAFMILVLHPSALEGISGVVKYRPEFAAAI